MPSGVLHTRWLRYSGFLQGVLHSLATGAAAGRSGNAFRAGFRTEGLPAMARKSAPPLAIAHLWERFVAWGDVDVIGPVRRIDLLLVAGGVFCAGYYGMLYGWMGALQRQVTVFCLSFLTCLMVSADDRRNRKTCSPNGGGGGLPSRRRKRRSIFSL